MYYRVLSYKRLFLDGGENNGTANINSNSLVLKVKCK